MKIKRFFASTWLIGLLLGVTAASATNTEREKKYSDAIVENLVIGEAEFLNAGGTPFLGLLTESEMDQTKGAVIILHGMGVHPDWADVIHPLRTQLPESGWTTLSLQMPLADKRASFTDYLSLFEEVPARVNAGIEFLNSKGIFNIAIIGHSLGGLMATYCTVEHDSKKGVVALITIGLNGEKREGPTNTVTLLEKVKIPFLDIYGDSDLDSVRNTAKARASASKHNKGYQQRKITGADHFFTGLDDLLVLRVRSWLHKNIPSKQMTK